MNTFRCLRFLLILLAASAVSAASAARWNGFALEGAVTGDNAAFELRLDLKDLARGESIEVVRGAVAVRDTELPAGVVLVRQDDALCLTLAPGGSRARSGRVLVRFAARTTVSNDWRCAGFTLPVLPVRRVTITADQPNLQIEIPRAANSETRRDTEGRPTTDANLALTPDFAVLWKPEIRQADSELVATCDIHTVASASPGTLRVDTIFSYRVAQGQLAELLFEIPDVNIVSVTGADIQDWRIDRTDPVRPRLRVQLTRPRRDDYRLGVVCERPLAAFPCQSDIPVLVPVNVIRAGGSLMLGTDSAVKLQVADSTGLTQIDPSAFPRAMAVESAEPRHVPARGLFAWQYAAVPYAIKIGADNVASAIHADINLLLNVANGVAVAEASIQLDIRDTPAREIRIAIPADPRWSVIAVAGRQFSESDVDTRATDTGREIVIPFRAPVEGQALVTVRLEASLAALGDAFAVPAFAVADARALRGTLVAAAEQGIRLSPRSPTALNDIHTASASFKAEGAQLAYRFRDAAWSLGIQLEYAKSAIHSEVFHLVSIGPGVVYVSAAVNGHVSGAPVQTLRFHVPASIAAVDVTGVGIESWSRSNDVCTVRLANRVLGDFTVLLSYDHPVAYDNADLTVGEIETLDTASELGFIAIATSAPLRVDEGGAAPATLIRIPRDEIPAGYAATVTAPVVGAWKFTRKPHAATLRLSALDSSRPIDQVVDYLALSSTIGRDGESVTKAVWHVKNTSRQFLEIQLPPGATAWSVRQAAAADVPARDLPAQQTGDRLLIPVERPRDPNQAIPIEVIYAQPSARARRFGGVTLAAPRLPGAPITFATWEVSTSDRVALSRATSGAMTAERPRDILFPFAIPRRHHQTQRFYRTATLTGEDSLGVTVTVVPRVLGGTSLPLVASSAGLALAGLLLALRRRRIGSALALAGLWLVALQLPGFAEPAAGAGLLVIGLACAAAFLRLIIRACSRQTTPPPLRDAPEPAATPSAPPVLPPPEAPADPEAGCAAPRLLLALALLGAILCAAAPRLAAAEPAPAQPRPLPMLDALAVVVRSPLPTPHDEPTAAVRWTLQFRTTQRNQIYLLPHQSVLMESDADGARYTLSPAGTNLTLTVRDRGAHAFSYTTREPLTLQEKATGLTLPWFPTLINTLTLIVPATDLDIRADQAAWLTTAVADGATTAGIACVPAESVTLTWRPRARDTRSEETVVYADISTVARVRPGVIEATARAIFNVVQGETRVFALRLPGTATATDVSAPGLATWRFDPATRRIEAVMARPQTGPVTLTLTLQTPCSTPPVAFSLAAPVAEGVARQRGRFAVAAPESLLLRFGETAGVTAIDTADFAARSTTVVAPDDAAKRPAAAPVEAEPLRRAFRYDDPEPVRIALHVEEVQPELRVVESAAYSLGDERSVLSSTLQITVARAGVFGVQLAIPEGYEIESLSGPAVSHWDDGRRAGRGIDIWFKRRIQDTTPVAIVLTTGMRGIPPVLAIPRVTVTHARRHTGSLAISAERGIRLAVEQQTGVTVRRDETPTPTAMIFDLLRPDWSLTLRTEVMPPVLKPDLLHRVELAEGMLSHRIHLHYRISNAGVRFFRVRVPVRDATLTVSGRQIARVRPLDETAGADGRVWEIELHGKVEGTYDLVCQYQEPYDPAAGSVVIKPFTLLDTARQATWLAVTCPGRVEVAIRGDTTGLQPENARTLPDVFNAGDLSSAILCYRAMRDDYTLPLSVTRHAAAQVLPATVEQVRIVTVVSGSGRLLAQATVTLDPGHMRFLRVALPSPEAVLWSALVNGAEVPSARADGILNIPLETAAVGQRATVSLVYADALPGGALAGRQALRAPTFPDLPLRDIEWQLFVPPEFALDFPRGAFEREDTVPRFRTFGKGDYETFNKKTKASSLTTARQNLAQLDELLKSGQQQEARKVLQQAVTLSQAEQSLNEDARVQFRNVVQQQVKMGIVNRRAALRTDNNIFDEGQQSQAGWNGGNFDAQYARNVEEQLDARDRDGLELVAQKLIDVQAGAAASGAAIQIAIPEHGHEFRFRRPLNNEPGGALVLAFHASRPRSWGAALALWPVIPGFLVFSGLIRLAFGPARRST
jgi:hypothetical protein